MSATLAACRPPSSGIGDLKLAPNDSYQVAKTDVAGGVVYWRMYSEADTQRLHVVVADLEDPYLMLDAETSNDSLLGFERTSEIFERLQAGGENPIVAINADFWHRDGAPVGMFVDDGQIWRGPWYGTDDRSGLTRSVFAFNSDNHVAIGLPEYRLSLSSPNGEAVEITDVNLSETGGRARVFTDRYPLHVPMSDGWSLISFSSDGESWIPNVPAHLEYRGALEKGRSISPGELVVAVPDSVASDLSSHPAGPFTLTAQLDNLVGPVDGVLGGLPRLIDRSADSIVVDPVRFAAEEGIRADFVTARHPRTAVGYDEDRAWLFMVVVDGRSESAAGIDLNTLAGWLRDWGCDVALNFDGGGSTTMVIRGTVVNSPSDSVGERPVSNVLLLRER
ncbi:MAG: phosphodiester glycosidase family protein [Rhodothermales bacterium]|nr:phosphodiester glycosidase family protein [Rhodothermales bacterium]